MYDSMYAIAVTSLAIRLDMVMQCSGSQPSIGWSGTLVNICSDHRDQGSAQEVVATTELIAPVGKGHIKQSACKAGKSLSIGCPLCY